MFFLTAVTRNLAIASFLSEYSGPFWGMFSKIRLDIYFFLWLIYSTLSKLILFDLFRRERLFWEIKCGVYQVQLFFWIFSQSFSISSISFFPGLDMGMSGIWPGTELEIFLLSCAMPLMIHNFLEPWCRCIHCPNIPGSLNLIFPTLPCFLLSGNHLFLLPGILHWNVQERSNSGWVFLFSVVFFFKFLFSISLFMVDFFVCVESPVLFFDSLL